MGIPVANMQQALEFREIYSCDCAALKCVEKAPLRGGRNVFFTRFARLQILVILDVGNTRLAGVDFVRWFGQRRQGAGGPQVLRADAEHAAPRCAPRNAQVDAAPALAIVQWIAGAEN